MATEEGPASAAGSGAYASAVPWNQIPKFIPGETDVRTYSRKLEFLQQLWPKEHLEHLGPRAALAVEGVAFQKVSRLDPAKLREPDGVAYLVQALGGQWGRLDAEEKYDLFERALYQVSQRADETNDSYMARHDAAFEDLMGKKVDLQEVRAYVLLRQSMLPAEDRKRVIMENDGKLTYEGARKHIRLLGSRFFQDLQGGTGSRPAKLKTYDVNYVDDENTYFHEEEDYDEENIMATMAEEGDEDAAFINDFEEQILVACQESSELASCFSAYQEARSRLREKARTRGFWPLSGSKSRGKGKGSTGKGKGYGMGKGPMLSGGHNLLGRRKTLADRIANSTCRRCGRPGHWKRECPMANNSIENTKKNNDGESFTGMMIEDFHMVQDNQGNSETVIHALPDEAQPYHATGLEARVHQNVLIFPQSSQGPEMGQDQNIGVEYLTDGFVFMAESEKGKRSLKINLTRNLTKCCRNIDRKSASATAVHEPVQPEFSGPIFLQSQMNSDAGGAEIFNTEEADDEAIIDTGASRAVIGHARLDRMVRSFPPEIRNKIMRVPTDGIVFKFGNAGRLSSEFAVLLPRAQKDWFRVEVVPGHTPFLISNAVLGKLHGIVDVADKRLGFKGCDDWIPLFEVRKNLLGVKVLDLLMKTPKLRTRAQTHILYTHDTHGEEGRSQSLAHHAHLHDETHEKHGGIQKFCDKFPKESCVHTLPISQSSDPAASLLSKKEVSTGGSQSACSSDSQHGHGGQGELPAEEPHITSGSFTARECDVSRASSKSISSSGGGQLGRVGCGDSTVREAPTEDLRSDLRDRSKVREPDVESTSCRSMGPKFPTILPSPTGSQHRETEGGHKGTGASDAHITSHDSRGGISHPSRGCTMVDTSDKCSADRTEEDSRCPEGQEGGQGVGACGGSGNQTIEEESASHCQHYGDPAQRDQGGPVAGADRDTAERSSDRAEWDRMATRECIKGLSLEHVNFIQKEVEKFSQQIQKGLDQLKWDPKYSEPKKSLRTGVTKKDGGMTHGKGVDVLEVYCEQESQITKVCNQRGGRAIRFTRDDGDLSTKEGRNKLWTWIEMYEPRHIWVAPECKHWGNWARYNMGRSMQLFDIIQGERQSDKPHLTLCNQIYLHQISHGHHFHMEQPRGSEMIQQPELTDVRMGTLPATFDMCQVGDLKLPGSQEYLQKRTQVFTTSRKLFERIHQTFCQGEHVHRPIKGKIKMNGTWRTLSAYAQAYTAQFARRTVGALLENNGERPLLEEELILGLEDHEKPEMAQESLQLQKRRRVDMKQPETSMYGRAPTWKDVFRTAGYETSRVGGHRFDGDCVLVKLIQQLVPEFIVKLVISCRGTDRHRTDGTDQNGDKYPLRKTVIICRDSGDVKEIGPPEEWLKLPRLKQIRSTGPAKMSLSIFGVPIGSSAASSSAAVSDGPKPDQSVVPHCADHSRSYEPGDSEKQESKLGENGSVDDTIMEPTTITGENPEYPKEGWAPRVIPKSGPKFMGLEKGERGELMRLHRNLGHPDPEKFCRFLLERGAKPEIVAGAKDMCCDTCVETKTGPKLSQPGKIHPNLDFNDVVGADGAYWRNKSGKVFHFMHFIDESTLFHVGGLSERKVENQIQTYRDMGPMGRAKPPAVS